MAELLKTSLKTEIQLGPGASAVKIDLEPGQHFTAEAGAMIAMSPSIKMTTTTHKKSGGGIMKGLKRMLSGESFFMNHYSAGNEPGTVWLSATLAGDMMTHELHGEGLVVQAGSYVASSPDVEVDFNWQGFKSFFSGESAFWLNLNGQGTVIFNSYGAIYPLEIDGDYIVDTGHIVAFEETLNFEVTKAGKSWVSSFLGGEGLVCKFKGKGTVWVQSHNPSSFGQILGPTLRPR
ncbi:TIGR00266 family protein [Flammeovirga aprica]|uniref:TIGR00266 family protein n=1 Tax=Flammeovirga aprica JL-4 TaxID=694437 RepID=A0A7X9XB40_9BACT|nr:TIGR00266 family protein [Flammeovirga aprica]NME70331.1 TIGR00266 family protein [Flammeovirga aprica JL-4]